MANLGSITINEIEIIEVDASPAVSGVDASIGSLAINTNGDSLFLKTGSLTTEWGSIGVEYSYRIGTANQTKNTVTYSNVTELTTGTLTTGTYMFNCFAICQSTSAAAGIGLRVGAGTATLSDTFGKWAVSQAAEGVNRNYEYDQLNSTTNFSSATVQTANTNFIVNGNGIVTLTTEGTIAVQIRSETTATVSIRIGSIFYLKKIL
jgi:hypothetical protein